MQYTYYTCTLKAATSQLTRHMHVNYVGYLFLKPIVYRLCHVFVYILVGYLDS